MDIQDIVHRGISEITCREVDKRKNVPRRNIRIYYGCLPLCPMHPPTIANIEIVGAVVLVLIAEIAQACGTECICIIPNGFVAYGQVLVVVFADEVIIFSNPVGSSTKNMRR